MPAAGMPPPFAVPDGQPPLTSPLELAQLSEAIRPILAQPDSAAVASLLEQLATQVRLVCGVEMGASMCQEAFARLP